MWVACWGSEVLLGTPSVQLCLQRDAGCSRHPPLLPLLPAEFRLPGSPQREEGKETGRHPAQSRARERSAQAGPRAVGSLLETELCPFLRSPSLSPVYPSPTSGPFPSASSRELLFPAPSLNGPRVFVPDLPLFSLSNLWGLPRMRPTPPCDSSRQGPSPGEPGTGYAFWGCGSVS